jgi:glycine oxidase
VSDVIVVGAGVIGCAVAFELAQAGARVQVLDARTPGAGASQASAGVLAPHLEGHHSPALRALGVRSLAMYQDFVARVSAASGLAVEFDRAGTLEVAVTPEARGRLLQSAADLRRHGLDALWHEPSALADLEPALGPQVVGALHVPSHAAVHVPALVQALVAAAARAGATFTSAAPAVRLAADADGVVVRTAADAFRAPQVVLATGAWAPSLAPAGSMPAPVRPIRGQLLCLNAAPRTVRHVLWAPDVYLVPWRDGTVFVGATSEDVGFDERATAGGVATLLGAALSLVPALAGATFVEARRGLRPASPDDLPYVGRSAVLPGLVYACGHYRNGALLAPLTAQLVAQLLRGDTTDDALTTLAPARAGRL